MGFVTVGRSVVVERERVQVDATDGIVVARAAAEHGVHTEAGQILSSWQRAVACACARGGEAGVGGRRRTRQGRGSMSGGELEAEAASRASKRPELAARMTERPAS